MIISSYQPPLLSYKFKNISVRQRFLTRLLSGDGLYKVYDNHPMFCTSVPVCMNRDISTTAISKGTIASYSAISLNLTAS